jgi:diguanylate cyclase
VSVLQAGRPRRWWVIVPLLSLLTGLVVLGSGWGDGLERAMREVRDGLRTHSASGDIVIVEIDVRSLRALDQWPWPRRYHAALVDRLVASGASMVAFDVNFAVRSNPADDAAFEAALARADGLVILPTFREHADAEGLEEFEALPYEPFRNNAFLGGVNILADPDGVVRRLPLGTFIAGEPRPSMASLLAESPGDIDQVLDIDFAIDPASIPRLRFIDVLQGRIDPAQVAGKRLFVGGTAADMEDRYTVPRHGVLPGVVVQALAAETILAGGVPGGASGLWPLLLALLATVAATLPGRAWLSVASLGFGFGAVVALPLATEQWLHLSVPVVPALAALMVTAIGALVLLLSQQHHARSLIDADTGLPNLRALLHRLSQEPEAVVVARVERFEALAAGLGPAGTATFVQRLAERIAAEVRIPVYRTDEHSLAWVEQHSSELDARLERVVAAMRAPVECGRLVDATLGIGVAEASSVAVGKQQVANAALAAERALRNRRPFLHFADAQDEESGWHLSLMSELSAAMAAGEVWNAYQPKLDLRSGRILGVEALVRWTHRERGIVGPDRFIPVVEASGRAAELTVHVVGEALADAARWQAAGQRLSVAVNVSATLLEDQGFIAWLGHTLTASPVPAETVTLEVTESAAVRNVEQAVAALTHWRSLGIGISIDDYGTGQSSLGYLQRLPASELKIDKSFVQNIIEDQRDTIMVRSTVALAHQLGIKVVAEGVEDAATLALLRELDCDVAQGYLIGRPMNASALEAFLAQETSLAA